MNRRVPGVVAAVFAGAALIAIATNAILSERNSGTVATDTNPTPSVSMSASPSAQPATDSQSATTSTFPADPCHIGAVTYCALNPAVTQATIAMTICAGGWTATVRPPSSYTSSLKVEQLAAFGYADQNPRDYEEDHRVPLELGGAPRDTSNLSPERGASPNPKDSAENAARADVCAGRVTLRQEQVAFIGAWLAPYPGYRQ
jgi:hypothetical protein